MGRIPLRVKVALTALVLVWVVVYWRGNGPANFLWFCDLANFLIVVAFWKESSLLLSAQAVSVVLAQTLWSLDLASRLLTGSHWLGATENFFDPSRALSLRIASLFHLVAPLVVLWGLSRVGYDRRGWRLQTGIAWIVLPASYWVAPEANINFVLGPSETPQTLLPPLVYLLALMLGYPLVVCLPAHLLFRSWFPGGPFSQRPAA